MSHLLKFEADCQSLQIIANSFTIGGGSANQSLEKRRQYLPNVGYLYPDRYEKLKEVVDMRNLIDCIAATPYEKVLAQVSNESDRNEAESNEVTIDDAMLKEASV